MSDQADTERSHILLVEDTLTQAMYMQHALQQAGYKVTVARSGEKALEALNNFIPDVVLTDINMPGLSGYELIKKLKAEDLHKNIKAIILVTASQIAEVVEILNSGADGLVFKSAHPKRFVAQVKLALMQENSLEIKLSGDQFRIEGAGDRDCRTNHYLLLAYQQIIDLQTQ